MTKKQLRDLHNFIYLKYKKEGVKFEFEDLPDDDFGAYIASRIVVIPTIIKSKQSTWSLFAMLHEVGHVLTNTPLMERYEKEFLATRWAINESRQIGFKVSKNILSVYQKYIWDWYEKAEDKTRYTKKDLTI